MGIATDSTAPVLVGKRYELLQPLGSGGMGTVFQAKDRLSGSDVALKLVSLPADQALLPGRDGAAGFDLALAQEFRALATIRHPHIVSVYDFGFSRRRQPYYTMEYLDDGQTIVAAGQDRSDQEKAGLLIQILQALIYLHRRGILHRDLKPTNALVEGSRIRLMDFGLSVITDRTVEHLTQTTSGTVAYLAPEIFKGAAYSRASDLYAVGLIAFQLFCGRFPYNESNIAVLLADIMGKPVSAGDSGVPKPLALVIDKLLAKERANRYERAADVVRDLSAAVGLAAPRETADLRESFLRSAKFVGRAEELSYLSGRLETALNGVGSVVLIGGESGVGKSRLVDEMRVRALVEGALVLQGQAISNGRTPYQLWLAILRSLVLHGELDPASSQTLMPLVPDLESLTGRQLSTSPASGSQDASQSLPAAVLELMGQMNQPIVIILEDLQWAGNESLQLLAELATEIARSRVLILGTYRDDEPMRTLEEIEPATRLPLKRLARDHIRQLAVSMLGKAGHDPQLVSLLQKETEGNTFFLVEAVRSLAEEAGQLDQISDLELPSSIITGGIREILTRRLNRVPPADRPLMELISVAGRHLDLELIRKLEPEADLDSWLPLMTEISILEAYSESWRFAHDKLREEIQKSLSHERHVVLHRRVAEALEAIYPDDPDQAAILSHHWLVAGDREKELHYAEIAGHEAVAKNALEDAIRYFERALKLLAAQPESPQRDQRELAILMELGPQQTIVRGFGSADVESTFRRAQELAEKSGRTAGLFQIIWGQFMYNYSRFDFVRADGLHLQLQRLAEESGDDSLLLAANHAGWTIECVRGDLPKMVSYAKRGLALYDRDRHSDHRQLYGHDSAVCALTLRSMCEWMMGYPERAMRLSEEVQALAQQVDRPVERMFADLSSAFVQYQRGRFEEAEFYSKRLLETYSQDLGSTFFKKYGNALYGSSLVKQQRPEEGLALTRRALEDKTIAQAWLPIFLAAYLEACLAAGAVADGLAALEQELAGNKLTGERSLESEIRRLYGELILADDPRQVGRAEDQFRLAIKIAQKQSARALELRATMSLAELWGRQGKSDRGKAILKELVEWFHEGKETVDLLAAKALLDELS